MYPGAGRDGSCGRGSFSTAGDRDGTVALTYDSSGHALFTCSSAPVASDVRVNELSTGTQASATDEFVELYNPGTTAADLGGFRLVYRSGSGSSDVALATIPTGTTLAPGGFYLFGGSGYSGSKHADQSFAQALAATAGGLGLREPSGGLVDSVAYGTATVVSWAPRTEKSCPAVRRRRSRDLRSGVRSMTRCRQSRAIFFTGEPVIGGWRKTSLPPGTAAGLPAR